MSSSPAELSERLTTVSDLSDGRLEDYRAVREADLVGRRGLFVAEGEVVLRVLIERSRFAVRSVLLSRSRVDRLAPLLARLAPGVPIFVAEQSLMNDVVGFNIHRGVLAVGERGAPVPPERLLAALVGAPRVVLALEGLTNHDNVGGVFRNAAAFGADAVLLDSRCCDPLYRKAIRVSVGGVLRVPFARCGSTAELGMALRDAGFATLALSPRDDAMDLAELGRAHPMPPRVALLLGTEGAGLSDALLAGAAHVVRIPIRADFDSLNVATTSGIALQAYRAAHRGGLT